MAVVVGKVAAWVTKVAHNREVRHDVALFAGALAVTGVVGDFASGVPLSWDVLAAAVITAVRRAAVQRVTGK